MQAGAVMPLKGKLTGRSWADLPPELIRAIGTWRVDDVNYYFPHSWSSSHRVRTLWRVLFQARELGRLCLVCPKWKAAIDVSDFWRVACLYLDSQLLHYKAATMVGAGGGSGQRIPFLRWHYMATLVSICLPCCLNYRGGGMTQLETTIFTYHFGNIGTCAIHAATELCGVCLKDARRLVDQDAAPLAESEDAETFPGILSTCSDCRSEHLDYALGTKRLGVLNDAECSMIADTFIDIGEGTVRDVIDQVSDKMWMNSQTKLRDMFSQAIASSRLTHATNSPVAHWSTTDTSEFDSSDSDEEGLSWSEEYNIKELAIADYNRSRIMDGFWLSPLDYFQIVFHIVHPPFALCGERQLRHPLALHPTNAHPAIHPAPHLSTAPPPPTLSLATLLDRSFKRQMEILLMPALHNIVQKVYWDCSVDGFDPCVRAGKMSLEDVIRLLRLPEVWTIGFNWKARRIQERDSEVPCEHQRQNELIRTRPRESTVSSDSSKSSEDDMATSPAVSHSTLQTTPSPPPITSIPFKPPSPSASPTTLESSPVAAPPPPAIVHAPVQYMTSIPYIPITSAHFPLHTRECFELLWKAAMAPLFQCQCSICTRRWVLEQHAKAVKGQPPVEIVPPPEPPRAATPTPVLKDDDGQLDIPVNPQATLSPGMIVPGNADSKYVKTATFSPSNPKKRSSAELDDELTMSLAESRYSEPKIGYESPRSKKRRLKDGACDSEDTELGRDDIQCDEGWDIDIPEPNSKSL